jgi:type VI secretion system protein ImpH
VKVDLKPQNLKASLIEQLTTQPYKFEFFQAVRLLERWLSQHHDEHNSPSVLHSVLHFRNALSLSFPASEIESLKVILREGIDKNIELTPSDISRIELTPAFMGLLGISGTLPFVYTEQIAQMEALSKEAATRRFLDLFTDRMVALFYKAWKKSRLHLAYEASASRAHNPLSNMVLSLAGFGPKSLRSRLQASLGGVHDESLAFFAGALQQRQMSAAQLAQLLSRYFGVGVAVEEFVGRWYELPPEARWGLGVNQFGSGVLGSSTVLGPRIWQRDLCVRLIVGPLDHMHFRRFLPGKPGRLALRELITTVCGVGLNFEINLQLDAKEVQGLVLDSNRAPDRGCLGWNTYVNSAPSTEHRSDVHFDIIADPFSSQKIS